VWELLGKNKDASLTVAYARVSSNDQKEDLKRQEIVLEQRSRLVNPNAFGFIP
jgi:predicted site-specific integrase-resolvase